ncbi:hypothetical protein N7490_008383 [Penicillium lividum]|nr:hypothetical protein N7490_008383 [Penicillium lividum]
MAESDSLYIPRTPKRALNARLITLSPGMTPPDWDSYIPAPLTMSPAPQMEPAIDPYLLMGMTTPIMTPASQVS